MPPTYQLLRANGYPAASAPHTDDGFPLDYRADMQTAMLDEIKKGKN